MNFTQTDNDFVEVCSNDAINITSLIGIVLGLLLNVWQSLMMKHITLKSECCKSCFVELSENE